MKKLTKKILSAAVVTLVLTCAITPPAHAIWWMFGCNAAQETLYSGSGHWETRCTTITLGPSQDDGETAYGNCEHGCGIDTAGNYYYIQCTEVWVDNPVGCPVDAVEAQPAPGVN